VEVAEGGTLFIDEIGEMAAGLQAKLLRVLEDGHYRRVGSTQEFQADVRVIAATNKVLVEEQKAGRFREDLYYRLDVVSIPMPALRDRRQDIPELVEHFLTNRPIRATRSGVHPDALKALLRYDWPGNVRELANVLERAQILAENQVITLDDLPESIVESIADEACEAEDSLHLRAMERRHVQAILQQERGNKVRSAKVLGISRRALYRLIEKHHLENVSGMETSAHD
jgi:transcriptional regulator with PAS, ATPase and Fis domain